MKVITKTKSLNDVANRVGWLFWVTSLLVSLSIALGARIADAEEVSQKQIMGLDEQVQEIKTDVLSIAAELKHLEEKLLYPSGSQVAAFLSLTTDDSFRLDSVEIRLDEDPVAYHLYSFKELEALREGGVQRIYTGNLPVGEHLIEVTMKGKLKGEEAYSVTESFQISKSVGPKVIEISLATPGFATEAIAVKEL
jgi:hypothetical protein